MNQFENLNTISCNYLQFVKAETDQTLLNKLRIQLEKSLASNKEKRDQVILVY